MNGFYGEELALAHAEGFETLAAAAAETLLDVLDKDDRQGAVLDLGCGAGPLSSRLQGAGFATWGIDSSAPLIELARSRMPHATFECGSIARSRFPRARAAAAVGEVLNYATAADPGLLAKLFTRVFDALEPGGVFLFDLAAHGRVGPGRGFTETDRWAVGSVAVEDGNVLTRQISTFSYRGDGCWTRAFEVHRLRLWASSEVLISLGSCGFRGEELSGYRGIVMPQCLHAYLARKPR